MLSLFPKLFSFAILVPVAFRLILGLYLGREMWRNYKKAKESASPRQRTSFYIQAVLQLVLGLMFIAGLFVQLAGIIACVIFLFRANEVRGNSGQPSLIELSFALAFISLSLIFLGPGIFAIDLPL
ncbi:MAG: hypothetical protein WC795_02775 [Candidatus Paceibacterota bacterium]|jgi:uncharacterized membrane protein YphA (DoxX/SURF4 family)